MVHAIQMARPGRRRDLQTVLDHQLKITQMPSAWCHAMDAVVAIEEAEAYAVEQALDPEAWPAPFDRDAALRRLHAAASSWHAAAAAA
ncbi:hypothetical protein ACFQ2B_27815 [Streptomyces stramineus]